MKTWLRQQRNAAATAARRLAATPLNSVLGAMVLGIALALPASGEMLLTNFVRIVQGAVASPHLSVFMASEAGRKEVSEVESRLRRHARVKDLRFVPRDETLTRMRTSGGLGDVLDSLPRNPFPDAYIVIPRDQSPEEMEHLRAEFAKYPKVEHVQLDSSWVKKLHSLLGLVRLALGFLAGLLGVALVAVTFNAIRLQVLTQDAEIELSRLLGATDAFVRRPFYYFGALQGLAGGLVAWVIVLAGALLLQQPVGELAGLYGLSISLQGLPLSDSLALLGFATLLGWLGAWLSLNSHLGSRSEF